MAASVAHQAGAAQAELVTESMTDPNISNDSKFRTRVSTKLNLVQSKEADGTYPIEAAIRAKERHKAQQTIDP